MQLDKHRTWDAINRGWMAQRSAPFREAVRSELTVAKCDSDSFLHHIGDDPGGIYAVIEGSFGVYGESRAEGIALGHIFRPGSWFGQGPANSGQPRYLAFRTMEPSVVGLLSLESIERIKRALPDAPRQFMSLSEYNQVILTRVVTDLLIRKSDLRIASVLLRILGMIRRAIRARGRPAP